MAIEILYLQNGVNFDLGASDWCTWINLAGVIGAITIGVWSTRNTLRESKESRLNGVRLILSLRINRDNNSLRVTNFGRNPAKDVKIVFNQDVETRSGVSLNSHNLMKTGFSLIPPDHILEILLTDNHPFDQYFNAMINNRETDEYQGEITYTDSLTSEIYREKFRIENVPEADGFLISRI